jgi:catechol 2,3-dioxygenase-like lactoylglutathione lyase family enzyme
MPRIFDHIDLRVANLAKAAPFYRAILPTLGYTVRVDFAEWLQYEAAGDGPSEFFGVTEDPQHKPNASRIAFWAESKARVDELAAMLPSLGALNIEGPGFESDYYYAVFFEDPSGNRLEVCHRLRRFTPA